MKTKLTLLAASALAAGALAGGSAAPAHAYCAPQIFSPDTPVLGSSDPCMNDCDAESGPLATVQRIEEKLFGPRICPQ